MKLSMEIYTVAERFGDMRAVELIKEAGFDAIDYSYYSKKECDEILGDGYRQYAQEFRAHMDRVGIACNQAHAPFSFKYGLRTDPSEGKYLSLIRALESASILGAKNIVVHAITVPEGVDFVEYNIAYYKSFIPYCERFGICVAVENLFRRDKITNQIFGKLGTPEELGGIIKAIASPWIVACVDVGHATLTGNEPQDFIAGMDREALKCLHVQDNDYIGDRHLFPYSGKLNWSEIMTALKKKGYDGDLTFEVVKQIDLYPNELLPDVLKLANAIGRHLISIYESA